MVMPQCNRFYLQREKHIYDRLWEKVHFRTKCNIDLLVNNSSISAHWGKYKILYIVKVQPFFYRWSDTFPLLLALTASLQRCDVFSSERARTRETVKCTVRARLLTLRIIRVAKETFWINNMASRAYTGNIATSETVAQALGELSLTQGDDCVSF